ncbi:P-II family nitrogen regulator [Acidobacteria bacterium AH-259-O06]|nr:P-II family nitrogen regulator [Acidobacteria bacterium AH-259-O06]
MKLIIAMIQPHKLTDVKQALFDAQVYKMTVSNALGAGEQKGYTEAYRGVITEIQLLKKVRIEIAVNEDFVEPTIAAIIEGARTGSIGDGKIFVVDLPECIRIRTGDRGGRAIG